MRNGILTIKPCNPNFKFISNSFYRPKTDEVYITAKCVRRYGLPDVDTESSEEDESQPEGMILMTKMTSVTPEVHHDLGARYHNE